MKTSSSRQKEMYIVKTARWGILFSSMFIAFLLLTIWNFASIHSIDLTWIFMTGTIGSIVLMIILGNTNAFSYF